MSVHLQKKKTLSLRPTSRSWPPYVLVRKPGATKGVLAAYVPNLFYNLVMPGEGGRGRGGVVLYSNSFKTPKIETLNPKPCLTPA